MKILQFFRNRRQAGFPLIKAAMSTGKAVLLGTENPADDPAPSLIANYRKLFGYGIAGLIGWAQVKFGWDIPNEAVDVAKDIAVTIILGLLVYGPRNNAKAS